MSGRHGAPATVVLDDDPTGVQTLAGIRVLLSWDAARIRAALADRPAVHLITNSRALPPDRVRPLIASAAAAAREARPDARLVLRGDSTLRGHLLEEYLGVCDVLKTGWPVLLLVPALPTAGRITRDGVHLFVRDGVATPLDATEYAHDGVFAYRSSRLLEWAEERSGRMFSAAEGAELHLDRLRAGGARLVADTLVTLAREGDAQPVVFAPDAETVDDLELIAAGWEQALQRRVEVLVRCAPTFAGVIAGTAATESAPFPSGGRVLVVCGSYVPQTTRQLAALTASHPDALVEADVLALAGGDPDPEVTRLARAAGDVLARAGVAILATPRERPDTATSLEAGDRVASGLARTVARIEPRPDVLVAKGGITSAVTLRDGVGAGEADVLGPVEPGVSRWSARWPDGTPLDYLVVPGNVGDDDLLLRLVSGVVRGSMR